MQLDIIIPVFNEAPFLAELVQKITDGINNGTDKPTNEMS